MWRAVLDVPRSILPLIWVSERFRVARRFAERGARAESAHSCKIWLGIGFCSE